METGYRNDLNVDKGGLYESSTESGIGEPGLNKLLNSEEPLVLEDYEGSRWMRSSCGTRPC